jgi:hypothetical protein
MPAQPGGPPVWLPGATQAAGPGTAALELDGVTPVLVSGGDARSAAALSLSPLRPAAGAARCHRLDAIVDILVTGAALADHRGRGWCRHLPPRSRWPGRRSRCRTGRERCWASGPGQPPASRSCYLEGQQPYPGQRHQGRQRHGNGQRGISGEGSHTGLPSWAGPGSGCGGRRPACAGKRAATRSPSAASWSCRLASPGSGSR